jgi:hypothetical protein
VLSDSLRLMHQDRIIALTAWIYWISVLANIVLSYFAIAQFASGSSGYKMLIVVNGVLVIACFKLNVIYRRQQVRMRARENRLLRILSE